MECKVIQTHDSVASQEVERELTVSIFKFFYNRKKIICVILGWWNVMSYFFKLFHNLKVLKVNQLKKRNKKKIEGGRQSPWELQKKS